MAPLDNSYVVQVNAVMHIHVELHHTNSIFIEHYTMVNLVYYFLPFFVFVGEGTSWSGGLGVRLDLFECRKPAEVWSVSAPLSSPLTARFRGRRFPFSSALMPAMLRPTSFLDGPGLAVVTVVIGVGAVLSVGVA